MNTFFDTELGTRLRGLFRMLLLLLVAFGINITKDQMVALLGFVEALMQTMVYVTTKKNRTE